MKLPEIKIAYIGGGSRQWARTLLSDLAQCRELAGTIDLYDIDLASAQKNAAIAEAIFNRPGARTRFSVRAVRRLADALRGADFVILSIEPGPTTMRYADLEIPARYGILQPVGDTTGPGGMARALRAVPIYARLALQIAEYCPKAWVVNYTNPMTLCVAALYAVAPRLKAFGCCHEVFHTQAMLAGIAAEWLETPVPSRQEIKVELSGINHFTWITSADWRGRDLMAHLRALAEKPVFRRSRVRSARANLRAERWFESSGMIAFDLLRRFGALGAAGDRHLAEFVPWYATSELELNRWGVILTPYAWRLRRARQADRPVSDFATKPLKASGEEGVALIAALAGGAPIRSNANLPNGGQAPDLPLGHIVETNVAFRSDRVAPLATSPLPVGAAALVRRVVSVQQLTLRAALERDHDLAFQALLLDPLVNLPVDKTWKMFKAMISHIRPHLQG